MSRRCIAVSSALLPSIAFYSMGNSSGNKNTSIFRQVTGMANSYPAKIVHAVEDVPRWINDNHTPVISTKDLADAYPDRKAPPMNDQLNERIAVWRGDITKLQIDGIVNAANEALRGGGGIDGAIHRAAGSELLHECRMYRGCSTGDAVLTKGYQLPSDYVIHTVGPIYTQYTRDEAERLLCSCYSRCIDVAVENNIRSIAFCALSTGVFGYPLDKATSSAMVTIRHKLEKEGLWEKFDLVLFCVFGPSDEREYRKQLNLHFPTAETQIE